MRKPGKTIEGKLCNTCGSTTRYVSTGACVPCQRRRSNEYQDTPAGRKSLRKANSRFAKTEKGKRMIRKNTYGIEQKDYDFMLMAQARRCSICDKDFGSAKPHVDHDHQTGQIRGLLCSQCNTAIGLLFESPESLRRAVLYLEGLLPHEAPTPGYKVPDWVWKRQKRNLKYAFGLTLSMFVAIVVQQNGLCRICRKELTEHHGNNIDHDHKTSNIRGILCGYCNRAIGLFNDDLTSIRSAVTYIETVLPKAA